MATVLDFEPSRQFVDSVRNSNLVNDANESVFFARQLEYMHSRVYETKRPPLNAIKLMPVSTAIPEGAITHTYTMYDQVGMAKIIANYADDLPRADVTGKQFTNPIRSIGNSYGVNMQELRSAQMTGINISDKKAIAAARAQDELINRLAFAGDLTVSGLPGFLSNTNIPEVTILNDGTGSSKTFATKTAAQIVRDVNSLINKIISQSYGIHQANQVWLPIEQYTLIASTQNSAASDTTVLGFLQSNFPGVQFIPVIELDGAGAGPSDRMVAMENSSDNWQLEIPMFKRQYPPQARNLEFITNMESRFAGVIIEYPLAFAFADGI